MECAYVASSITELPYFASKVTLGPEGVAKVHGLGELTAFEKEGVKKMMAELKDQIQKGIEFASRN